MNDASPPQKLARYRSQKRIDPSLQEQPNPTEPLPPNDDNVARSKSRYRRRAPTVTTTSAGSSPPSTAHPELPQQDVSSRYRSPSKQLYQAHIVQSQQQRKESVDATENLPSRQMNQRTASQALANRKLSDGFPQREVTSDELTQSQVEQKPRRHTETESRQRPPTPPPMLPETVPDGQLFPPPKPKEIPVRADGPPQSSNIRATKSMSELRKVADDDDSSDGGCFPMFKRKRLESSSAADRKTAIARPKTAVKTDTSYIKPGGGGIVPGTDAPVSAVNAGDRRVLLECGQSKTLFPVTPTTTPVDLLKSAALCMSENIDVKSAILLESFNTVGVQRPLRRYEHLRDIMNSWDTDSQNSLILLDPDDCSRTEEELTLAGAPRQRPGDNSWVLQFSQKPGKWERRVVSLKSDGQITCQKESDKTKDLTNLCHLSDFDIYTPTQERARKRVKPPKKYCFAIKSQQKSNMFESTQNFVHFFSTGDKATADDFYASIQGWRSWYLVNVMGEGRKQPVPVPAPANGLLGNPSLGGPSKGHRKNESIDSHYQLGSFQPLLDIAELQRAPEVAEERLQAAGPPNVLIKPSEQPTTHAPPVRRTSVKRQQPVPVTGKVKLAEDEPLGNFHRRASVDKRRPSVEQKSSLDQKATNSGEFKATGLLGRSYSQRQRDYTEKEVERNQPFTDGPNLLNGGVDESNHGNATGDTFRRHQSTRRQNGDLHTSKSVRDKTRHAREGSGGPQPPSSAAREMPKPLVDLTPEYREPVQHAKKGRGFHIDSPGPNGLVASATSPDELPGAAPTASAAAAGAAGGGAIDPRRQTRSQSLSRSATLSRSRAQQQPPPPPAQQQQDQPFTGEGLLAGSLAQQGWGGGTKGRGVMDGSRVVNGGRPMLVDDNDELHGNGSSFFAQGSLLDRVSGPAAGPIIDREKRDEIEVRYGEGF